MAIDEASWLSLERRPGETLRAGLERTLRDAIRAGALREGVRLPSSRALAQALGVSRGVVTDAYAQLEAQGFLVARVRAAPGRRARRHPSSAGSGLPSHGRPPPRHDLIPVTPDVTLFPLARWARTAHQVASRAPAAALDYGESRGERVLREALADHLGRTRGVIAEPEQIVVVQGTAQGIEVVLRLLGSRRAASRSRTRRTRRSTSASARMGSSSWRSRSTPRVSSSTGSTRMRCS